MTIALCLLGSSLSACSAAEVRKCPDATELRDERVVEVAIARYEKERGALDRGAYDIKVLDEGCGYVVLFNRKPARPDADFSISVDRGGVATGIRDPLRPSPPSQR